MVAPAGPLSGADDGVTTVGPVLTRYPRFAELIGQGEDQAMSDRLRKAESIGRPLGDDAFVAELEKLSHRTLKPAKPGPKRKTPRQLDLKSSMI